MAAATLKQDVIRLIAALPDDVSLEEIHYRLYVREKVERGLRAIDEGRVVPQQQAEQLVRAWLR